MTTELVLDTLEHAIWTRRQSRGERHWRDVEHVEIETLHWVHWFNHERTHRSIDDLTPIEIETAHYAARNHLSSIG